MYFVQCHATHTLSQCSPLSNIEESAAIKVLHMLNYSSLHQADPTRTIFFSRSWQAHALTWYTSCTATVDLRCGLRRLVTLQNCLMQISFDYIHPYYCLGPVGFGASVWCVLACSPTGSFVCTSALLIPPEAEFRQLPLNKLRQFASVIGCCFLDAK